jgi:hypothetical protein
MWSYFADKKGALLLSSVDMLSHTQSSEPGVERNTISIHDALESMYTEVRCALNLNVSDFLI